MIFWAPPAASCALLRGRALCYIFVLCTKDAAAIDWRGGSIHFAYAIVSPVIEWRSEATLYRDDNYIQDSFACANVPSSPMLKVNALFAYTIVSPVIEWRSEATLYRDDNYVQDSFACANVPSSPNVKVQSSITTTFAKASAVKDAIVVAFLSCSANKFASSFVNQLIAFGKDCTYLSGNRIL